MMLEQVAQHHVTITFSKEDCRLLAHMLTVAADYEATGTHQTLAQAWLTAATTVFETAALVADAGGLILDGAFNIPDQDVEGFTVQRMRTEAAALIGPTAPAGA